MSEGGICSITSTDPDSNAAVRAAGLARNRKVTVPKSGLPAQCSGLASITTRSPGNEALNRYGPVPIIARPALKSSVVT